MTLEPDTLAIEISNALTAASEDYTTIASCTLFHEAITNITTEELANLIAICF